jgi:oligopeptidase A
MTELNTANPLFRCGEPPLFDAIGAAEVKAAIPELLSRAKADIASFEASIEPTWTGVFDRLRDIIDPLGYAWGVAAHLMGVRNSDELRAVYEELQPNIVEFFTSLGQNEAVYKALKSMKDGETWDALDEAQRRILDKELLDMELSGISLEGEERERFNAIQKELAELSTGFSNAVLDSTKAFELILEDAAEVDGLPDSLKQMTAAAAASKGHEGANAEAGPWRLSLDIPVLFPFLQHSRRPELREQLYKANITRASTGEQDNGPRIERLLALRRERAKLLGYATHAEVSLASKMAPGVEAVEELSEELRAASRVHAEKDHAELIAFAREQSGDANLELKHSDINFWSERLREQRFDYTAEELRPYFPFPKVLEGLFTLTTKLFGVTVVPADGEWQVWHPDVRCFKVLSEQGAPLAGFYLDPYSRPENKRGGAWMNGILGREPKPEGGVRAPLAVLVCNQTPPVGDTPSLMTHREVETLFHEFGHGLQHMLTTVEHPQAAGINNVEWDAVELPSQFMENWTYHQATVMGFARHHETDEPLPKALFDKIVAARNFRSGSGVLRQLYFGRLDMELHHRYQAGSSEDVSGLKSRVAATTTVLAPLPEDRFENAFGHIFAGGYAAGYYSYMWAEVLSADAFGAFEDSGLDDPQAIEATGRRFRDTVLAQGGSRHPMDVFRDFRGRSPSTVALLRHRGLS